MTRVGAAIGRGLARARDSVARTLVAAGVGPNALTLAGAAFALAAGLALAAGGGDAAPWTGAAGASVWPLVAAACVLVAGAMDVLDGATARAGGRASEAGGFLDSTLDRVADFALYGGCAFHFALRGNLTLVALALAGLVFAFTISYVKARAECVAGIVAAGGCDVGFWQRPERILVLLVGAALGHVPAALWLLGTASATTALLRVRLARALLEGREPPPDRAARGGALHLALAAFAALFVVLAPRLHPLFRAASDPLGDAIR